MKITIGLTTWSEHPDLIHGARQKTTLGEYAQHFPVVELDTFFYALPTPVTVQKWLGQVAPGFQFVVKAHASMTGHKEVAGGSQAVFERYLTTITPLAAAGQLKCVLFQFPPYFDATNKNIHYLKRVREWMGRRPVAIELRNQSWYQPAVYDSLVSYCRDLSLTLVAADEPHEGPTGIPFALTTTTPSLTLLRLHGRNQAGWANAGANWRKQRTLYRYSPAELAEFKAAILAQEPQPRETCVIFNNNSGGDAAANALALAKMMGLHFTDLLPRDPEQLDLF